MAHAVLLEKCRFKFQTLGFHPLAETLDTVNVRVSADNVPRRRRLKQPQDQRLEEVALSSAVDVWQGP